LICYSLFRDVTPFNLLILLLRELIGLPAASQGCQRPEAKGTIVSAKKKQVLKRLTFVCLGLFLITAVAPDAFARRGAAAVSGPMGGGAVRGPMGGTAVRGPMGGTAVRGPHGGGAYHGGAYRGVHYGHAVVRPGVGVAAGVAVGAAAGAAHAAHPNYYYPPHY
jgi:preprotein translocase subunit SecG